MSDHVRNWVFRGVQLLGDKDTRRAHENEEFGILKDANKHYNKLVEIERRRLDGYRKIREDATPGITEAQDAFDEVEEAYTLVREEIKEHRKQVYLDTGKRTREVPDNLREKQQALTKQKKEVKARYDVLVEQFEATIAEAEAAYARRRHEPAAATVPEVTRARVESDLRRTLLKKKNEAGVPWTAEQFRDDNPEYRKLVLAAVAAEAGPRTREKINARVLAEMLAEDWPAAWKLVAELDARKVEEEKGARDMCGLSPGCYQPAEEAAKQAIKNSRWPKFRSFCGGKIGLQLKVAFGDVVAGRCSGVRLEPLKKDRWATDRTKRALARGDTNLPTNPERDSAFYKLSLRVGKKGRSYWISYSVQMDRLPPDDVLVKRVYVNVRQAPGERVCRDVQWVLEGPGLAKRRQFGDGGVVELRFCSRVVPGGVKVAEWRARNGSRSGDVVLPNEAPRQRRRKREYGLVDRLGYPAILRSHADTHFNEVRAVLRRYVAMDEVVDPDLGKNRLTHWWRNAEVFRANLRHVCEDWAKWLFGEEHLRELWSAWRDERLAARRDLFPRIGGATRWVASKGHGSGAERIAFWLFLWSIKDKHLRRSAAKMRERAQHQRDAVFREAAIELAKSYDHLVCDGADLSKQKRRPKVEEESNKAQRLRQMRQDAAPGRCREIFKEVFAGHVDVEDLGGVPGTETAREQDQEALSATYERGEVPDAAE